MKKIYNYKLVFTIAAILTSFASHAGPSHVDGSGSESHEVRLRRNVYVATNYHSVPLHTWDRCSEHSRIGARVAEQALNEAMDQCESEYNTDCVYVSTKVWPEISIEFVGYKKCAAKVRVHGYEVD